MGSGSDDRYRQPRQFHYLVEVTPPTNDLPEVEECTVVAGGRWHGQPFSAIWMVKFAVNSSPLEVPTLVNQLVNKDIDVLRSALPFHAATFISLPR